MSGVWIKDQADLGNPKSGTVEVQQGLAMTFGKNRSFALGRLKTGQMNKTEEAYARDLENKKFAGEILWYKFEGLKLRLADNTFYTPDFVVLNAKSELECHEVKGFWQDDARAKIKIAADIYPFRFVAVKVRAKKNGGGWEEEEF